MPRLFVDTALSDGASVALDAAQASYLGRVMRLGPGAPVLLFDDRTGEWAAAVEGGGRHMTLRVGARLRVRESVPDLWLLAAPLKRGRVDWLAEKACELGVARLCPVLTERTVVDKLNTERLRAHMVEAAEQCGRTALPALAEPLPLAAVLAGLGARMLLFCDETGGAPAATVFAAAPPPAAILIGPEGGFTPAERAAVLAHPGARALSLGPRILRADTAAVAAVSLWQAAAGDWR